MNPRMIVEDVGVVELNIPFPIILIFFILFKAGSAILIFWAWAAGTSNYHGIIAVFALHAKVKSKYNLFNAHLTILFVAFLVLGGV